MQLLGKVCHLGYGFSASTRAFQRLLLQSGKKKKKGREREREREREKRKRRKKTSESEVSKQHLRCIAVHRSPCGLGDKRPFSIVERAYFTRKRHGNTADARGNLNQEFIDSGVLSANAPKQRLCTPSRDSLFLREETQHFYFTFSWIASRSNLS